MIRIPAGETNQGSDRHYPDEGPVRRVAVSAFDIDPLPVTNQRLSEFIAETGYVTVAERSPDPSLYPGAAPEDLVPGALVFTMPEGPVHLGNFHNWWAWTPGATWRTPLGPESDLDGLEDHPVVQVSYDDALAFCEWAGLSLATETEWEYASRGGLEDAEFAWGDHDPQESEPVANTWQGGFPYENTEVDGWTRTSPVGFYASNGYGLFDMIGNVWEWTDDWYLPTRHEADIATCCVPQGRTQGAAEQSLDPSQPNTPIPRKVVKGGSHLCTPQYCFRYRPSARQPQMIDTATSHIGFRCVSREESS
ncbi:MAG: formylglycine-generating enzyme family protein [Acidimicrobiia bacterium]